MSQLSKEVDHLKEDDALHLLNNVNYHDLKKEYWFLARERATQAVQTVRLPDSKVDSLNVTSTRVCCVKGCENEVVGKAKKCKGCKA